MSRRQFLEAAGFSMTLAALAGCERAPVELALPYPVQPVGQIPGLLQHYSSTCAGCAASCGLSVGVRDGRPLKMEGLPEHPLSRGGLCAVGQALPIGLYDKYRLAGPLRGEASANWDEVDREILQALSQLNEQGRAVRFVSPTIASPTLRAGIGAFLDRFQDAKHVVFDSVSCSAILDAHEQTHGTRVLPHYRFDRAETIVSFGADFLGTWISPVEFTAGWSTRRVPTEKSPDMSFHCQLESRVSLTGSNADRRYAIHPREQGPLVARLAEELARQAGKPLVEKPTTVAAGLRYDTVLADLAQRLWQARGKCLVVSDSQDVAVQRLVNYINHLLGNYGSTLDIQRPSLQRQGNDRDLERLVEELETDQVGALLVYDCDLVYELGNNGPLKQAIGRVPLTISFSRHRDSLSSLATFTCPDHHPLESWLDAEPVEGVLSLAQPSIRPLFKTRAATESLSVWSNHSATSLELLRSHWERAFFPRRQGSAPSEFDAFWDAALHDGFVEVEPSAASDAEFRNEAIEPLEEQANARELSLILYNKIGMPDARHAQNPWLQELPDPVTKITWGNYVTIAPENAEKFELSDGDIVEVATGNGGPTIELPVCIQLGQSHDVLGIALAYGCQGTDRFAKIGPQWLEARPSVSSAGLVGENAAPFIQFQNGTRQYVRAGIALRKTGKQRELARTQLYNSLEVPADVAPHGGGHREAVQRTTLSEFAQNAHAGEPEHAHHSTTQLWPEDHPQSGHAWGMVIDLNKCTGCSACVVACQAENNIPVVGYDEVRRQREMHWMRIDRYYSGEGENLEVAHQPMMCQHCDNAPCETVCPVLATVQSQEGLNEQVYNRCVGTRYCANNCPYKVRRFNWFAYAHDDTLQNLLLNPDVTVRSRGVMEKCSMCVQRIEAGRIDAQSQGRPIVDGAIRTACQQSCPADAIVFGDMHDPNSKIHAALQNPRRYRVLEELNVRPAVSYLRVVRNRDEEPHRG